LPNAQHRYRVAVSLVIFISWLTLVVLMWRAFRTLPTAAELADARHIRPPLPADFIRNLLTSTAEMVVLVVILWPRWVRQYILRVALALAMLVAWFFATVPLDLNTMEWLHRRWLALLVVLLLVILLSYPILQRRNAVETQS
jgi:hypothetical protein